jgi:hypothetical protein
VTGPGPFGQPGVGRPSAIEQQTTESQAAAATSELGAASPFVVATVLPYVGVELGLGAVPQFLKTLSGRSSAEAAQEIQKYATKFAAARAAATQINKTGLEEGAEEGVQQALSDLVQIARGDGNKVFSADNAWKYVESVAGGYIGGGVISGPTASYTAAKTHQEAQRRGVQPSPSFTNVERAPP